MAREGEAREGLGGVTAIVTRAREQAADLAAALEGLGARVVLSPAIRFAEPASWAPFDGAVTSGSGFDWVVLTSVNGVAAADRRLRHLSRGWDLFHAARFAAIGPATAEALERIGVKVALVPDEFRAEGILEALARDPVEGKRILIARAEKARDLLPDELARRGATVVVAPVYRTLPCPPSAEALAALRGIEGGRGLLVIFTSPSTVAGFVEALPGDAMAVLRSATVAAIGPVTAEALSRHGLAGILQPAAYTVEALVAEIEEHYARRKT